jgi:hypothetical protein
MRVRLLLPTKSVLVIFPVDHLHYPSRTHIVIAMISYNLGLIRVNVTPCRNLKLYVEIRSLIHRQATPIS